MHLYLMENRKNAFIFIYHLYYLFPYSFQWKKETFIEEAKKKDKSLWRVSSNMFATIRYDVMLEPIPEIADPSSFWKYPAIRSYDQIAQELCAIELLNH